jgi:hypothetical protein
VKKFAGDIACNFSGFGGQWAKPKGALGVCKDNERRKGEQH